jgi:hypothetical protein
MRLHTCIRKYCEIMHLHTCIRKYCVICTYKHVQIYDYMLYVYEFISKKTVIWNIIDSKQFNRAIPSNTSFQYCRSSCESEMEPFRQQIFPIFQKKWQTCLNKSNTAQKWKQSDLSTRKSQNLSTLDCRELSVGWSTNGAWYMHPHAAI